MASHADIDDGADDQVKAAVLGWFEDSLGPDIAGDARRYCPERTGSLKDSIEHHIDGDDLIVSATGGDDGRTYAAYVELGHRVYHPSTGITGPEVVPPQPFLRPALYQQRGG